MRVRVNRLCRHRMTLFAWTLCGRVKVTIIRVKLRVIRAIIRFRVIVRVRMRVLRLEG